MCGDWTVTTAVTNMGMDLSETVPSSLPLQGTSLQSQYEEEE